MLLRKCSGEGVALAVEIGKVRGGNISVWGRRLKRAELQTERDGGDSFLDAADSSIEQQYRIAFCALKYTRSTTEPAI